MNAQACCTLASLCDRGYIIVSKWTDSISSAQVMVLCIKILQISLHLFVEMTGVVHIPRDTEHVFQLQLLDTRNAVLVVV